MICSQPRQIDQDFWAGKKVFITGHTGFKGSWLSLLLLYLGCDVYGFSSCYPTTPCLFTQLELESQLNHHIGDIQDQNHLNRVLGDVEPDIVFHLAAQPLVRESYRKPVDTWSVNVIGTINLMQALRSLTNPCSAIIITTDKVYENKEWSYSYREIDPLGGYDPYSSSKAATELAISCWRSSFFDNDQLNPNIKIVSARSGNVIGGGDWAEERIIPDIIRSLRSSQVINLRNPHSTRPWQHVLDPLAGYLFLAESLSFNLPLSHSFNFGPSPEGNKTVQQLVEQAFKTWPGTWKSSHSTDRMHEANLLNLAIDLAHKELSWYPRWDFSESVYRTINWYKSVHQHQTSPYECCMTDLKAYLSST